MSVSRRVSELVGSSSSSTQGRGQRLEDLDHLLFARQPLDRRVRVKIHAEKPQNLARLSSQFAGADEIQPIHGLAVREDVLGHRQ